MPAMVGTLGMFSIYICLIVFVRIISFPLLFWVIGGGCLVGLDESLESALSC